MQLKQTASGIAVRLLNWLAGWSYQWGWRNVAAGLFKRVLRLEPTNPIIHVRLCSLALEARDFNTGYAHAVSAYLLAPGHPWASFALACSYTALGRIREAFAILDGVVKQVPGFVNARTERGYVSLGLGHIEEGYQDLRALAETPKYQATARLFNIPSCPLWDGSNLNGKTILLWSNEGYGDALQFIRYVPLVAAHGGTVIVKAPTVLARLFSHIPGIAKVVTQTEGLSGIACHVPLTLLPTVLKTTAETIPNVVPYLSPPEQVKPVPCRVPGALKVGLVWAADKTHERDSIIGLRSLPPSCLYPLLSVAGVEWYSLQVGPSVQELAQHGVRGMIHDLSPRLTDFDETAGVIRQLDLVISVDTAVAHLAGALGMSTWLLLPYVADPRWMIERIDTPWYPTLLLFRQTQDRVWMGPVLTARMALEEIVKRRGMEGRALEEVTIEQPARVAA